MMPSKKSFVPLGSGLLAQMHVGIDESGQQGRVAEIDDLGVSGNLDVAAHGLDFGSRHDHDAMLQQFAGQGIEQMRGFERDGTRRRGLRETPLRKEQCRNSEHSATRRHALTH
jgi:hypothetical protein